MTPPIRVLIADDHALVRSGLRLHLEMAEVPIEVVGEVEDGAAIPPFLAAHEVDVVTVDIGLPHTGAVQNVVRELKETFPDVRLLVVTGYRNEFLTRLILNAGADGFIVKDQVEPEFVAAVVAPGEGWRCMGEYARAVSHRLNDET